MKQYVNEDCSHDYDTTDVASFLLANDIKQFIILCQMTLCSNDYNKVYSVKTSYISQWHWCQMQSEVALKVTL